MSMRYATGLMKANDAVKMRKITTVACIPKGRVKGHKKWSAPSKSVGVGWLVNVAR